MEELQRQIDELKIKIDALNAPNTFPYPVVNAIIDRVNPLSGTGASSGSANTQAVSVPTTPVSITVPAQPSGTIPVVYKGQTYNVLFQ